MKRLHALAIFFFFSSRLGFCERLLFEKKLTPESVPDPVPRFEVKKIAVQTEQSKPRMKTESKKNSGEAQRFYRQTNCKSEGGNLPKEYLNICHSKFETDSPISVVAEKQQGAKLTSMRLGDKIIAYIEQSIKASPNLPTPVVAVVQNGVHRGGILHGYATLDPVLKRVIFHFEHFRMPGNGGGTYALAASGHALNGQIGVEGDYNSGENKYVATAFAVDFASALLDTSVQRNTTLLGTQVPDQSSVSNRLKQSASVASAQEGERLLEKARSAPEWTEIPGGQEIQVIINSEVREVISQ